MKQNRSFQDGLRKWINGNIRAKEEAQLDQLSQEDAFAREALEGLRSFADTDHSQNINRLRQKLQKKNKPPVLIPILLRRIAAAVLFLAVAGTVWWLNQPSQTKTLSLDEARTPKTETPISSDENQTILEEATNPTKSDLVEETTPTPALKINPPKRQSAPTPPKTTPVLPEPMVSETVEAEEEVLTDEAPPVLADLEEVRTFRSKPTPEKSAEMPTSSLPQAYEDLPIQAISGRVLDSKGQPVAGALIQDLNNQQQTRSDLLGNFTIPQPSAGGQMAGLQISHFNYADTTMALKMDQGLEINLQNGNTASLGSNNTQQPYPVGGFSYFQEISSTKRQKNTRRNRASKKETAGYAPLSIRTTIRFTVYADGKLGNFQVLSSPDIKTERSALKKLQEGPKWVLPSGLDSLNTQITIPMQR